MDGPRQVMIATALTETEALAVRREAESRGLSVSTLVRRLLWQATNGLVDFDGAGSAGLGVGEGGSRDRRMRKATGERRG